MTLILPTAVPARSLAKKAFAAALFLPALLAGCDYAVGRPLPPSVPLAIQVPAGNEPFLLGHATGTQNYTCQPSPDGYAWTFVAPSARLVDDDGKPILGHFAGPTWQAKDGSTVKGVRVDGAMVSTEAIDWLLLRAAAAMPGPDGGDRLVATTYIQRINTTGGLAPATGCDASTVGAAAEVPYTADYYLYERAPSE
jgi:hypothetical protein